MLHDGFQMLHDASFPPLFFKYKRLLLHYSSFSIQISLVMGKFILLAVLTFSFFTCNLCANSQNSTNENRMEAGNLTTNEAMEMCNKTYNIKIGLQYNLHLKLLMSSQNFNQNTCKR